MIALQIAPLAADLLRQLETFPVLYLGKAARRTFSVIAILGLVVFVLFFATNSGLEFLLDPTLGGRAGEIRATQGMSFLPPGPLQGFDESLYASGCLLLWPDRTGVFFAHHAQPCSDAGA